MKCLFILLTAVTWLNGDTVPKLTDSEQEQFLKVGKITRVKEMSKGVTGSNRVIMTAGGITHEAHVQCMKRDGGIREKGP